MVPWSPARTRVSELPTDDGGGGKSPPVYEGFLPVLQAPAHPAQIQIKLSIQRLRSLQEKKLALAKKSRREIADLLQKGRVETARLRVEGLIQDDIYVELLELLELYSEMLQARFNLLDASGASEPEPSISDAVCAIVYAAPRTELKELQILREMLMHKYGRAFSLTLLPNELPPPTVPARVVSKLALFTPSKDLVDAYLGEIARGYNVDWLPESTLSDSNPVEGEAGDKDATGGDVDGEGGPKETPVAIEAAKMPMPKPSAKGLEARSLPAPPDGPEKDAWASSSKGSEEEELAKRFERLKNLR